MVRAILVARLNAELDLFTDGIGHLFFRGTNEVGIEKVNAVLLERAAHALPGLEIAAYRRGLRLLFQWPRALNLRSINLHCGLRGHQTRGQREPYAGDCRTPEHFHFCQPIWFPKTTPLATVNFAPLWRGSFTSATSRLSGTSTVD